MARPLVRSTALLAVLLVTACSGDDESASPTAAPVTTTSTGPTLTLAPVDTGDLPPITPLDTSDLPTATPLDTSDLPTSSGPIVIEGCPVGDWFASQQELQAFYDTIGARAAMSFVFSGSAELRLRGDGRLSYVLEDFFLQQEAGGTHVDVRLTGTIDGVYTASGSVLLTTDVEPNVTAEAFVDDSPMDSSAVLDSFVAQFPFNEATYQCTGDDLVMDIPVLGTTHTMTFTPAT